MKTFSFGQVLKAKLYQLAKPLRVHGRGVLIHRSIAYLRPTIYSNGER